MNKLLSFFSSTPLVEKKTIIKIYLFIIWLTIALIAMTANKMVSYNNVRYFFWVMPIFVALLFTLFIRGPPLELSKKENKNSVFLLILSFICLILAFFSAIVLIDT
jgi:Kef-type K+ transport system membrane component KefB